MAVLSKVYVALLHWPVQDRNGRLIAAQVTHLDVHDIARTCRSYGVAGYWVVHPVEAQQRLIEHMLSYWEEADGLGAHRRKEALRLVRLADRLDDAIGEITGACGAPPFVVATSATLRAGSVEPREVRVRAEGRPVLLVFGTGWGLCDDVFAQVDATLAPIDAGTGYNHLPVRAAVAVILDRMSSGGTK